jgi:putative flippase GtrA
MALTIHLDRRQVLAELGWQGFRFALTGGFVAVVYVGATSLLAEVIGLDFQAALAIGFALAIATHFTLQRLFVWRHPASYALPVHHQLVRYLLVAAIQYGLTAIVVATLPHVLGTSSEVVYLPTVLVISAANFLVFRSRIFHPMVEPGN